MTEGGWEIKNEEVRGAPLSCSSIKLKKWIHVFILSIFQSVRVKGGGESPSPKVHRKRRPMHQTVFNKPLIYMVLNGLR